MLYFVYFSCPHCKNPYCGKTDMGGRDIVMIRANTKKEARNLFNRGKECRHMKISEIN